MNADQGLIPVRKENDMKEVTSNEDKNHIYLQDPAIISTTTKDSPILEINTLKYHQIPSSIQGYSSNFDEISSIPSSPPKISDASSSLSPRYHSFSEHVDSQELTLDGALEKIPVGKFHFILLTLCGLSYMSDSIEVSLLSFLSLYVAVEWELSLTQLASITAAVFAGSLIGASLVWGPMADRYGRRVSFLIGSFLISTCSLASAFSSNFYFLIVFRFFVGVGVGSGFVPFDLLAEFLPSSHRGQYLMNINYFWTMGSMIVNGTAWIFLESYGWRTFVIISTLPVLLGAVLAAIYLPESPRWLLQQQKIKEAENVLYLAAKINQTTLNSFHLVPFTTLRYSKLPSSTHSMSNIPHDDPQYLIIHSTTENSMYTTSKIENMVNGVCQQEQEVIQEQDLCRNQKNQMDSSDEITWEHYLSLLQPDYITITVPLWIVYFSYGVTYYGVILLISRLYSSESSESSSLTNHVTFNYFEIFTNACSEIIGIFLASNIIDSIGRKLSQISLYSLAAFSVLILPFTTSSNLRYFISLICRISILAACGITWVVTPELYPTSLRAVGHSLCTSFSRIGAIISPYIVQNQLLSEKEIGIILFFLNLISMLAIAYLPETLGRSMEISKKG